MFWTLESAKRYAAQLRLQGEPVRIYEVPGRIWGVWYVVE